jgi:hypothetical protein
LAAAFLDLAACAPDRATAPAPHPRHVTGTSNDVMADAAEQLLYLQPPLPFTNVFTGGFSEDVAAVDFVVPPGGNWRVSRVVMVGQGFPSTPGSGTYQINVFEDDGSGQPGHIIISGVSAVPAGTANPCCGGEVFDYSTTVGPPLDLPPGRYWITNRLALSTRTFNPQLALAVGYPGLIGRPFFGPLSPVPVPAPNNDFAFSVYGTVETAAEAAADLLTTITGFGLPDGTFNSLQVKLNAAQQALDAGDDDAACRAFQDLINAVSAQSGKKLTEAQASTIIDEATRIRGIIGC